MCFGDKGILAIYSVFHKKVIVFFFSDNLQKKTSMTDTLMYYTR